MSGLVDPAPLQSIPSQLSRWFTTYRIPDDIPGAQVNSPNTYILTILNQKMSAIRFEAIRSRLSPKTVTSLYHKHDSIKKAPAITQTAGAFLYFFKPVIAVILPVAALFHPTIAGSGCTCHSEEQVKPSPASL